MEVHPNQFAFAGPETVAAEVVLQPPVWTGHADFDNPFKVITFPRLAGGVPFDLMLEAKAKDLAVLRLRRDLPAYAPVLAALFHPPKTRVAEED